MGVMRLESTVGNAGFSESTIRYDVLLLNGQRSTTTLWPYKPGLNHHQSSGTTTHILGLHQQQHKAWVKCNLMHKKNKNIYNSNTNTKHWRPFRLAEEFTKFIIDKCF
jgi:hypothetical protein